MATLIVGYSATHVTITGRRELLDAAVALGLVAHLAAVGFGFFIQKKEGRKCQNVFWESSTLAILTWLAGLS